jgi:hypothetical protein
MRRKSDLMMLPDFLVIGAEKSATTWIYNRLREHPDIFLPETKEISYFNKYNSNLIEIDRFEKQGLGWYTAFFRKRSLQRAAGEVSPMYLCDQFAPQRIKETVPEVRLIAILRNPIERAYSHYQMALAKRHVDVSFEEIVISKDVRFIKRGLYAEQIKRYYELFDRNQILILLMDDVRKDALECVRKACDFLGVDAAHRHSNLLSKENESSVYRSAGFYNIVANAAHLLRRTKRLGVFIDILKSLGIVEVLKSLNSVRHSYPPIENHLREELLAYYRQPNNELSGLINRDLRNWNG